MDVDLDGRWRAFTIVQRPFALGGRQVVSFAHEQPPLHRRQRTF
jgi:hypothetical protein